MVLCSLLERRYNVIELSQKLNIPQAALSNQLTILREAGEDCEIKHRDGLYFITDPRAEKMLHVLHKFFANNPSLTTSGIFLQFFCKNAPLAAFFPSLFKRIIPSQFY